MQTAIQVARLAAVMAMLCAAAALATPPGSLPLALRGLRRVLRRDAGAAEAPERAGAGRRALAFALVLAAIIVAVL